MKSNLGKAICATLLLLFFSGHFVLELGYLLYFKANQAEIAAQFCENKAKPQLQCNGKCHLADQLKKSENTNDATSNLPAPESLVQTCILYNAFFEFTMPLKNTYNNFFTPEWQLRQGVISDNYRPPKIEKA